MTMTYYCTSIGCVPVSLVVAWDRYSFFVSDTCSCSSISRLIKVSYDSPNLPHDCNLMWVLGWSLTVLISVIYSVFIVWDSIRELRIEKKRVIYNRTSHAGTGNTFPGPSPNRRTFPGISSDTYTLSAFWPAAFSTPPAPVSKVHRSTAINA